MSSKSKSLLTLAAAAALLGGCATGPYYDNYGYNDPHYYRERPVYPDYGPEYAPNPDYAYVPPGYYYPRAYVAPSISFGFGYGSGWHHH